MKTPNTTLLVLTCLLSMHLQSQEVGYKTINTSKLTTFPDSVMMYSYSFEGDVLGINSKQYFTLQNNILEIKHYADLYGNYTSYYLYALDLFYYNENGLPDSAIIQANIDNDWDIYAIKKNYTYSENLMASETIFWDKTNDSVNNNWVLAHTTTFKYNNENQLIESVKKYNESDYYKFKTTYTYNSTSSGSTRTDTLFSFDNDSVGWLPISITENYYNANGSCKKIKSYNCSSDSGLVAISTVIQNFNYNDKGQLMYDESNTPNTQPSNRTDYEYSNDGMLKEVTFSMVFSGKKELWYSYEYYYAPGNETAIDEYENNFTTFPNPVTNKLQINLSDNPVSPLLIYNANGQLIKSVNAVCGTNIVDFSTYKPGLYYLQIMGHQGISVNKIIKQ